MEESPKYKFEKLTPISDGDISVYEEAIDTVFTESDIRNVAISGSYGAGKSSLIAAYKNKHPEKKFIHISLAHFQNNPNTNITTDETDPVNFDDTVNETASIKESVLEGKILNQLIHQIPAEKIPQTNFRVKKSISMGSVVGYTIAIVILLLTTLHNLLFFTWKDFVESLPVSWIRSILSISNSQYASLISGVISLGIICFLLFVIVNTQKNKNIFKKLNFQGNEIEIFEESEESYFDKYLNEVLYLFENIDADVIVFEDMDRFDASRIFERLREINTLANIQRTKENKTILRFFYLLRDDIFISKDRTKFFDLIIPVVPVVDSSNSYNQFITHLRKNNLLDKFDESFLQGISLYVDDMRLLKNICNEFLIYYSRLNTTELNYNKMFALITYKNLFPRDFSDLQLNRGFVYSLFENKGNFVNEITDDLKKKIDIIQKRIENANNEIALSERELKLIFKPRENYYGGYSTDVQKEYDKRLQAIQDRKNDNITLLESEKHTLEEKIQKISNYPLAALITRDNIDDIFRLVTENEIGMKKNYHEIKSSEYFDLVKYLIRNGFIDETYADYMTYFYENSLSRIDKVFLRSITDKKAKAYDYQLTSPQMVFKRLKPTDFDQEETLNFQLYEYLLNDHPKSEHLYRLIAQIRDTEKYRFIAQFFEYTQSMSAFISITTEQWPEIFTDMQSPDGFTSSQLKRFTVYILYHALDDALQKMNTEGELTEYIENSIDYLAITSPDIDLLIESLKMLSVRFPEIDYDASDKDLYMAVYENDLYVLNYKNMAVIFDKIFGIDSPADIRWKNYTILAQHKDSPLYKRVKNNINEYMAIILSECEGCITDDENNVIFILNHTGIDISHRKTYIQYLNTDIHDLSSITEYSLWESLIASDKLVYSEKNVMDYFLNHKKQLSPELISFINRAKTALDFSSGNTSYPEEHREALFDEIISCNGINNQPYEEMITTLGFTYNSFDLKDIDDVKVKILINNDVIPMESETLKHMRKEYPHTLDQYIRHNIDSYVKVMTDDLYMHSELIEILSWNISDETKLKLLQFSSEPISIVGKGYSHDVILYILKNNLQKKDMDNLYITYDQQDDDIKEIILKYAERNILFIIDSPNSVNATLIKDLMKSDTVQVEEKIELFVNLIPFLANDIICDYLSLLELNEFIDIFNSQTRPKYEITERNTKILEAFKNNNIIYDYPEDDSRQGFYKIQRREPKKDKSKLPH